MKFSSFIAESNKKQDSQEVIDHHMRSNMDQPVNLKHDEPDDAPPNFYSSPRPNQRKEIFGFEFTGETKIIWNGRVWKTFPWRDAIRIVMGQLEKDPKTRFGFSPIFKMVTSLPRARELQEKNILFKSAPSDHVRYSLPEFKEKLNARFAEFLKEAPHTSDYWLVPVISVEEEESQRNIQFDDADTYDYDDPKNKTTYHFFIITINGKPFMTHGKLVRFSAKSNALKAIETMQKNPWSKGKTFSVGVVYQ